MGEFLISESKLAEGIYNGLLKRGYVPESNEILDIAAIVFDYLVGETEGHK
jgi:hypothetical protein